MRPLVKATQGEPVLFAFAGRMRSIRFDGPTGCRNATHQIHDANYHSGRLSELRSAGRFGAAGTDGGVAFSETEGRDCAIVSDDNVAALFAEPVERSLTSAGFKPTLITVPPGEESKTLGQAEAICNRMSQAGLDRSSFLVALGGGMVGDLAGFAAAIYHRGIPYVQMPTTLLAQVDSSIGGKTAVNTAAGKNMIGAWHHPALVISDVDTLGHLPPREWKQGFAEIIKHAVIRDAEMFEMLQHFERKDLAGAGSAKC